jgi:hypothetical protein
MIRDLVQKEVKVYGKTSEEFINKMRYIIGIIDTYKHQNPIDISIDYEEDQPFVSRFQLSFYVDPIKKNQ